MVYHNELKIHTVLWHEVVFEDIEVIRIFYLLYQHQGLITHAPDAQSRIQYIAPLTRGWKSMSVMQALIQCNIYILILVWLDRVYRSVQSGYMPAFCMS